MLNCVKMIFFIFLKIVVEIIYNEDNNKEMDASEVSIFSI